MKILYKLILLLAIILMAACSAQQRLNKLLKKHPELVKSDTILKDTIINAPAIKDSVKASFKSDSGAIGAVIDNAKLSISDSAKKALKDSLNSFLNTREKDTTITSAQGIKYHIKEKGNNIQVEVEKDPQPIKFKYPQIINKVAPVPELSFMDKIKIAIGKYILELMSFLLLLLIIYIAYRLVRKRFFL